MTASARKHFGIICRSAPYGCSLSKESLEIALASSVFDQPLSIVFTGEGVWQLLKQQDSNSLNCKNHGKLLSSFPLYDINNIYIDGDALQERQLSESELLLNGTVLSKPSLATLINRFDIIFNF